MVCTDRVEEGGRRCGGKRRFGAGRSYTKNNNKTTTTNNSFLPREIGSSARSGPDQSAILPLPAAKSCQDADAEV